MKLPYGLLADQFIHISEVQSGRTDVQCPYCNKALVAKKGKIKRHHFAHAGESCMLSFSQNLFSLQGKLPIQHPLFIFAERKTKAIQDNVDRINQQYSELQEQAIAEKKLLPELFQHLEKLQAFYLTKQMHLKASQIQELRLQVKKFTSQKIAAFPAFHLIKGIPFTKTYTDGTQYCTMEELEKDAEEKEYYYPSFFHKYVQCLKNYSSDKTSTIAISTTRLLFQRELSYFKRFKLYFLEVRTEKGSFHKIGLTSRAIETRMQEITQDLQAFYKHVEVEVLFLKENYAFLETFFKQKYSTYQMKLGILTEYFQFPSPLLASILLDFELVGHAGKPPRNTELWAYWAYQKSTKKIYGYTTKSIYVEGQKIILSSQEESIVRRIRNPLT